VVFHKSNALVMAGGEYKGGSTKGTLFYCDKAGPHQDGNYLRLMMTFCEQKGWKWEPQALQISCVNNLDVCVFPMMSKQHSI
jgi:hypothetical protein